MAGNISNDLKKLLSQGLWPGPMEADEQFEKRVSLYFKVTAIDSDKDSSSARKKAHSITISLFGFSSDTLPITYSNKDLTFWEGAALFIEEENDICHPHIQLRKGFLKGSYLCYKVEEVLSHEMFHAARIEYKEPKYEEIFAYKTSKIPIRRYLGPLFQSPKESYLFVILLMLALIFEMGSTFVSTSMYLPWMVLPFLFIGLLWGRLYFRHRTLSKAACNIRSCIKDPSLTVACLARLKDSEIDLFAVSSPREILSYLNENKEKELRIRAILLCFF
ncbi:MAG: hypothetical protein NTX49_05595 [Chlamydiae bacterium]|nr:hypothetical protein [Chlamydiota bacterium]